MTINEANKYLIHQLCRLYDEREAKNIASWVIENITGFKRTDVILNKHENLTNDQSSKFNNYVTELLQHKPVQYVLNEAWFAGMKLYVDESVLIPRPETEELVEWIIEDYSKYATCTILDIGTGSGCIAIALKNKLKNAELHALDISTKAIEVAKRNAEAHGTNTQFYHLDILNEEDWKTLSEFDVIVSNPPYVKRSEAIDMSKNVLDYEPHSALFVHDDDSLIFYKKIIAFAKSYLKHNGSIFFELNESAGAEVKKLLIENKFVNIKFRKDLEGKQRMIKASKQI